MAGDPEYVTIATARQKFHFHFFLLWFKIYNYLCSSQYPNFFNPLLFASCTDKFSKWCKITRGMKRSAQ
jgi:hypothetical protein